MATLGVVVFIGALLGLIWTGEKVAEWKHSMARADGEAARAVLLKSFRWIVLYVVVEIALIGGVLVAALHTYHVL